MEHLVNRVYPAAVGDSVNVYMPRLFAAFRTRLAVVVAVTSMGKLDGILDDLLFGVLLYSQVRREIGERKLRKFIYDFFRSEMNGVIQTAFYFGYQIAISYAFFLSLGALGFLSSIAFVKKIYKNLHMD